MAGQPNIELRSEKARNIIGQIPSSVVRKGSGWLFVTFWILIAVTYWLPHREKIVLEVEYYSEPQIFSIDIPAGGEIMVQDGLVVKKGDFLVKMNVRDSVCAPFAGMVSYCQPIGAEKWSLSVVPAAAVIYALGNIMEEQANLLKTEQEVLFYSDGGKRVDRGYIEHIYSSPIVRDGDLYRRIRFMMTDSVGSNPMHPGKVEIVLREYSLLFKILSFL